MCKDILFGLFTACLVDYSDNKDSDASILAYDSAPGGIYDLDQVSAGAISQIGTALPIPIARVYVQPQFCFIPTTSALDIGGGSVALGPQNLTAAYSGANRPAPPFTTPFSNFITASRENLTHILWNGLNSKWAFQEMQGAPPMYEAPTALQPCGLVLTQNQLVPGRNRNAQKTPRPIRPGRFCAFRLRPDCLTAPRALARGVE